MNSLDSFPLSDGHKRQSQPSLDSFSFRDGRWRLGRAESSQPRWQNVCCVLRVAGAYGDNVTDKEEGHVVDLPYAQGQQTTNSNPRRSSPTAAGGVALLCCRRLRRSSKTRGKSGQKSNTRPASKFDRVNEPSMTQSFEDLEISVYEAWPHDRTLPNARRPRNGCRHWPMLVIHTKLTWLLPEQSRAGPCKLPANIEHDAGTDNKSPRPRACELLRLWPRQCQCQYVLLARVLSTDDRHLHRCPRLTKHLRPLSFLLPSHAPSYLFAP
jgi:hypothetical protein